VTILAIVVCLTAAPAGAETPDEIYSFAIHLQQDELWEAAAAQFLRFARENPTDPRAPDALFRAAECLGSTENAEQAVTVLEAITSTYPDHPEQCRVQVQLGRLYYKLERYSDADRVFTRVVVTMPECQLVPEALLGKGEALMSMGDHARAAEVLRRLVEGHIESKVAPRASFNLAFCYKQLERTDEALRTYEGIVVKFPGDPLAGFAALEAARMNAGEGDVERAIQFYTRAKQFETRTFAVPAGEEGADLLVADGQYDTALEWYEELLARSDLTARRAIHIKAVVTAYDAGRYDAVKRLAGDYQDQFPGTFSPQITYTHARSSLRESDYESALADAERLERFAPGTEWAHAAPRIRGEASLGQGNAREGVDQLELFVSASGDSAARCDVLRQIADVSLSVTQDTTAALEALDRLLDVQRRRLPREMLDVAGIHEQVYDYGGAYAVYKDIVRRYPLSDEAEQADARTDWLEEFTVTDYASAARAMDQLAYGIASNKGNLITLVDARIYVMKDFDGALSLVQRMLKPGRDLPHYPDLLYYEGLCWSKKARQAAGSRDEKARRGAGNLAKNARKPWAELEKKHADNDAAARAAFAGIALDAAIGGEVDTRKVEAVLSRYPSHPEGATVLEYLGDQYASGGADGRKRAVTYYGRSLALRESDEVQLKLAVVQAAQGREREALETFERLAGSDDGRIALKASYEAGRALRSAKRYGDAIKHFDRVAVADPGGYLGSTAALQAADCVFLQKDYDAALSRYLRAERLAPGAARRWEASYRVAMCLRQMGRFDESLDRMVGLLLEDEGGSQRSRVFEEAAEVAEKLNDEDARVTILEAYIDEVGRGEGVVEAQKQLVRLYLARGESGPALELAQELDRNAAKDDIEPRALLAMALYREGKSGDAKKAHDAVSKQAGVDAEITREIGIEAARYQYDQKQYAAAVTSIRPFAENCTGEGACEEARFLYAMSLFGAQDIDRGAAVAQSFFRDYPVSGKGPMLHLRVGNVLAGAGRTNESFLHYEEAAETASDPEVAFLALKNLGISYQKATRWKDAENAWRRIITRFPGQDYASEAAMNLARCKMEYGDYNGAIAAYEEVLPSLQDEAKSRAFYWMGQCYERLGDYQSAVVEYLKVPYLARSGGMWVVTAQLKAAECYTKIDRDEAARDLYTKVLRAHGPTSNWGKLAQKGLDGIDGKTVDAQSGGGER